MDLDLDLKDTHVVITGGAGHIGSVVVQGFLSAGAKVSSLDIVYQEQGTNVSTNLIKIHADISSESSVQRAWQAATSYFGPVQTCVALGALDLSVLDRHENATDLPLEQFRRTLEVNVLGTFLTARLWLRGLKEHRQSQGDALFKPLKNASLIMIGSESGHWGECGSADYGTSKAAVQYGLLPSLRQGVPRVYPGARVNAIAPGPVNTARFHEECKQQPSLYYSETQGTVAMKRPVELGSVAKMCLFLASERWSRDVMGQILNVDGGKMGKVMWREGECENPYA